MIRKFWSALALGLLIFFGARAGAEVTLEVNPSEVRTGDIVRVEVQAGSEAQSVIYDLSVDGEQVFSGKEDEHFSSAFRPRKAGTYTLKVTVKTGKKETEEATARVEVSGEAEVQQGEDVIYSQKDGWWKDKAYSKNELQKAGCAIFTLSHALQRMGWSGEDVLPENLAVTYKGCYTEGGTANARLITRASEVYAYTTKSDLLEDQKSIAAALKDGAMFSFSIVIGHIALISGTDDDGKHVRIVDSAPGATFERIKKGSIYYLENGEYREAAGPEEIPGAVYYFETATWGGLEYYMDLSYVARRGVRLIQPGWMFTETEKGRTCVFPVHVGSAVCTVTAAGEEQEIPTAKLFWQTGENAKQQLAWVTGKSGAKMTNGDGKKIASVPACSLLVVLAAEEDRVWCVHGEDRGYLALKDVELLESAEGYRMGQISIKGNTSGRAKVRMRLSASAKSKTVAEWKTGTRVAILQEEGDFLLVEAQGLRVWVQKDYVTPEEETAAGAD